MTGKRLRVRSWICVALVSLILLPAGASAGEGAQGRLRREKARLTEMRERAEKAAAELNKALKRERASRHRVDELQQRLSRQRRLIARIDDKLSALAREQERAEAEVRAVEAKRADARRRMESAAAQAFVGERASAALLPLAVKRERMRYWTAIVLASEQDRADRLAEHQEKKKNALSRIERQVHLSEKRISREKRVGASLLSQRANEAKRLERIRAGKARKQKELEALRARVARMERLVSRIERLAREAERRRSRGTARGPSKFSSVPGGLVAPVRGRVVEPFGKVRDPVFDVEVENHGIEIEAPSGSPVRSIGKGKVVFSGTVSGFGNVLIIQHGAGLFSVYGKAASFIVARGQAVGPGQNIGRLPESPAGKSVLYLELRAAGAAIDPAAVIPLPR